MGLDEAGIKRRAFLKQSAIAGLGAARGRGMAKAQLVGIQRAADDS